MKTAIIGAGVVLVVLGPLSYLLVHAASRDAEMARERAAKAEADLAVGLKRALDAELEAARLGDALAQQTKRAAKAAEDLDLVKRDLIDLQDRLKAAEEKQRGAEEMAKTWEELAKKSLSLAKRVTSGDTEAPVAAAGWRRVGDWRGSGPKTTETFTVSAREWRVRWRTTKEALRGAGMLQAFVYDGAGKMISLAANHQGLGGDTSYVRAAPGKFYLDVGAANVTWEIVVEAPE